MPAILRSQIRFLSTKQVRDIHSDAIRSSGGSTGLRAPEYLDSAVEGAATGYYNTLAEIAAAYAYAITKNHPFIDGNKRAAFVAAWTFLNSNGIHDSLFDRPRWRRTMLGVAKGTVTRESLVRRFRREMKGDVAVQDDSR